MLKILIDCKSLGKVLSPILDIADNVPQFICSDEMRIKQVILNLISNCIKFTRRGHIRISAVLVATNQIEICIEDTGIGIKKSDIKNLFKEYSKLGNQKALKMNAIGSGLGLSICKKIVNKLGDCIKVESIPGEKTIFFFNILNMFPKPRRSRSFEHKCDLHEDGIFSNNTNNNDRDGEYESINNINNNCGKRTINNNNYFGSQNILNNADNNKIKDFNNSSRKTSRLSINSFDNYNNNRKSDKMNHKQIQSFKHYNTVSTKISLYEAASMNNNNNNTNNSPLSINMKIHEKNKIRDKSIIEKNNDSEFLNSNRNNNKNINDSNNNKREDKFSNTLSILNNHCSQLNNNNPQKNPNPFRDFQVIKRIYSSALKRNRKSMFLFIPKINIHSKNLADQFSQLTRKQNLNKEIRNVAPHNSNDTNYNNSNSTLTFNTKSLSIRPNNRVYECLSNTFSGDTVKDSQNGQIHCDFDVVEKFANIENLLLDNNDKNNNYRRHISKNSDVEIEKYLTENKYLSFSNNISNNNNNNNPLFESGDKSKFNYENEMGNDDGHLFNSFKNQTSLEKSQLNDFKAHIAPIHKYFK